jgi:hypothetical protein
MFRLKDLMMMFDIPERTIRRHIKIGLLKGKKVGGSWRFSEEDIRRYLDNSKSIASTKKRFLAKVNDFFNGFTMKKNDMLISINHSLLSSDHIKTLTSFVSEFEEKFFFGINSISNQHNITFIGHPENAIKLIRKIGEIND